MVVLHETAYLHPGGRGQPLSNYLLLDSFWKKIKPEFENALKRIFKLCCSGGDNIMSYNDLTRLQSKVFGSKLLREEIDTIKSLLNTNAPGSVTPAGITEEGALLVLIYFLKWICF